MLFSITMKTDRKKLVSVLLVMVTAIAAGIVLTLFINSLQKAPDKGEKELSPAVSDSVEAAGTTDEPEASVQVLMGERCIPLNFCKK